MTVLDHWTLSAENFLILRRRIRVVSSGSQFEFRQDSFSVLRPENSEKIIWSWFCLPCLSTYRRWDQSTSYNVAHPACGHNTRDLPISPRFTPTSLYRDAGSTLLNLVNQWLNFPCSLTSTCFPLRKLEDKLTPAETRTLKLRLNGRMVYPLDHGCKPRLTPARLPIPTIPHIMYRIE